MSPLFRYLLIPAACAALASGCTQEPLTSPGASAAKAPARNHYQLAYTASASGNPAATELFFRDTRTGVVTQLTTHPGRDQMPSWSPAGDQIVFSTTAFSGGGNDLADLELAIMSVAAGGTPGTITQITWGHGAETHPAWSPTGDRIAYACDLSPWPVPHQPHICYSQFDGTGWQGPFPLTADPPPWLPDPWVAQTRIRDMHPTWSPDGQWVLFSRRCVVKGGACNFDDRELFMVQIPTSPAPPLLLRVTLTPGVNEENPSCQSLPGSRTLVYKAVTYYTKGPVEFEAEDIYLATLPSALPLTTLGTQLTSTGENAYPWWSPGGDEILFLSWRDGTWDVFRMLPDGSHQRNLTATLTLDESFARIRPSPP